MKDKINMKKLNVFFLILVIAGFAFGQLQPDRVEEFLRRDFHEEVKTADFVSPEVVKKHSQMIDIEVKHGTNLEIKIFEVSGNKLKLPLGHAILDVNTYVQQRLGVYAYTAIKNGMVDVKVFSGTEDSFFKNLDVDYPKLKAITKIPSLYEEWGIAKYLVKQDGVKPILIFKIPTSYRYAQHYATMIRSINNKIEPVVDYDQKSESRERYDMIQGATRLTDQLGKDYSIISFGYSGTWINALNSDPEKDASGNATKWKSSSKEFSNEADVQNQPKWKFMSKKSAEDSASGIGVEVMTLENTQSKKNLKVLLLSSKKTVWGELATMMISAFLHKKVESVVFMGSAGAVSNKNSVYDLSVPERFVDKEGRVDIENVLHKFPTKEKNGIKINFESTHGNTFSPIEQNKPYLIAINNLGIDTIDVEQSLLGRQILDFNKKNKSNVKFGAINLITDKPFSLLQSQHSEHDLDRIDKTKKSHARMAAVEFLLSGLASPDIYKTSCSFLFD
jgi:hypothetical protein